MRGPPVRQGEARCQSHSPINRRTNSGDLATASMARCTSELGLLDRQDRGNIERDLRRTRELEAAGWLVLRFWERELLANVGSAVAAIEQALVSRRQ